MVAATPRKRVLLLGGGHAHLHTLKHADAFLERGYELALLAADRFWYSDWATGILGGDYSPLLDQIDIGRLVTSRGGRFFLDEATRVDVREQVVHRRNGEPLSWDVLSLNLGCVVPLERIPGAAEYGYPIKPIGNLCRIREKLQAHFRRHPGQPARVVVIGGDGLACEVVANIERLARRHGRPVRLTLLCAGRFLKDAPEGAIEAVLTSFQARGVEVELETRVARVEKDAVHTTDGRSFPCDLVVHAFGLKPHPLLGQIDLPRCESGGLRVTEALHSVAAPNVFAGGGCVSLACGRLPHSPSLSASEGPVLFHNLLATLEGRPLLTFQNQPSSLFTLNLGDDTGLAAWGGYLLQGRLAWWFKDWRDRRFLAAYQA